MARARPPRPIVVDFETMGIEGRPSYPPLPVGVSIKCPEDRRPRYYAWGHLVGNNCSWGDAQAALAEAWERAACTGAAGGLLFQNGKFDIDVAETHFGLPRLGWECYHDTLFLLFLDDPNQLELGLKPSAERLLGLPPEEQDAVADWLIQHQPVPGARISRGRSGRHPAGRYIAFAPGGLVGAYADGDVTRTEKLFQLLWPKTAKRGMLGAYDRERELMPILLEVERQGVRVDLERLRADCATYSAARERLSAWLIKELGCAPDVNLDSGAQLVAALLAAGKADEALLGVTATGKPKSDKDALMAAVSDARLLGALKYRTQLNTCLNTFMLPWLAVAERSGGLIFTTWNQTKSAETGDAIGTRTGRLSSTPNFQNIPKEFAPIFQHDEPDPKKRKLLPRAPIDLPPLPLIRGYVVPYEKNHILIDRDYCFGPGTEVLTDQGFVLFEDLAHDAQVAQWENGEITYAEPLERQRTHFTGSLVHVVGERSTDLFMTPNHQCLLVKDHQVLAVRADEYPAGRGHYQQVHAGATRGALMVRDELLVVLAALQADATIKPNGAAVWKLKKERKIERLEAALRALGLAFASRRLPSCPDYITIRLDRAELERSRLIDLIDLSSKTFKGVLRLLAAPARLVFLKELALWDGSAKGPGNWAYFTTHGANADLVQELAAITGLRAVATKRQLPSGKTFTTVSLRTNYLTWTETFTRTEVPYDGPVHCVTMPAGTVIVRRNGRVSVTFNSQQEPRILAHFDGGALMQKYIDQPWIDFHDSAQEELAKVGKIYDRKPVKNTNLGLIYGMGNGKLAAKNDMTVEEAAGLKKAILALYPGLKEMYKDMSVRAKSGQPIRTWGGREYYCEPPKLVDGRIMTFDYKMVNSLIQGSAADCTKQAIINYWRMKGPRDRLLINVHDELLASVPKQDRAAAMERLRVAMESVKFDVPILSEGSSSATSWGSLTDYDKKGKILHGD